MNEHFFTSVVINAPASTVWHVLIDPLAMKQWMSDTDLQLSIHTD